MTARKTFAVALALTMLAGCSSVDDVRAQPVRWAATYPGDFDTMANCLAALSAQSHAVTPQLYQRERRANITWTFQAPSHSFVAAEYRVRQISDRTVEVDFREMPTPLNLRSSLAREYADRCGKETT